MCDDADAGLAREAALMTEFRSWAVAMAEGAQRAGLAPDVIENLQQVSEACTTVLCSLST